MSVINRNITRTILDSTETTLQTRSPSSDTLTFELTSSSKFYVGFNYRFTTRYFHFDTLNTTQRTISVKYWNGTAYAAVEDLIDQTLGFTRSGFISWANLSDWVEYAQSPLSDKELYWIEVTVNDSLDAGTKLQSVLNLFSDDDLVRSYYPELISDARYLPPGRDDFIEQHVAAKDLTVLRLKQDGLIEHEGQIIDINEVAVSAVHAFRWIVLNPIAKDDSDKESADKAYDNFIRELNRVKIDVDFDESGIIEEDEEKAGNIVIIRG